MKRVVLLIGAIAVICASVFGVQWFYRKQVACDGNIFIGWEKEDFKKCAIYCKRGYVSTDIMEMRPACLPWIR